MNPPVRSPSELAQQEPIERKRIDIFCRVIDNLGDAGISWRLARQLQTETPYQVRLWIDDLKALRRLLPPSSLNERHISQTVANIEICRWLDAATVEHLTTTLPHGVISAFSCDLPAPLLHRMGQAKHPRWINLEYLSAEDWVPEFHGRTGLRGDGLAPVFYFPGFQEETGGLLREHRLVDDMAAWAGDQNAVNHWLSSIGVQAPWLKARAQRDISPEPTPRLAFAFCYPDAPLAKWFKQLGRQPHPTLVLIPKGMQASLHTPLTEAHNRLFDHVRWQLVDFVEQASFDRLLWSTDFNIVRGEDSFVRAIWSGKPLLWHIYQQEEEVHHTKLQAWLETANLPAAVADLHHDWSRGIAGDVWQTQLQANAWQTWQQAARIHRDRLLTQESLVQRLLRLWET